MTTFNLKQDVGKLIDAQKNRENNLVLLVLEDGSSSQYHYRHETLPPELLVRLRRVKDDMVIYAEITFKYAGFDMKSGFPLYLEKV